MRTLRTMHGVIKLLRVMLTGVEVQRVADLMKVWQYLYDNRVYDLCDIVSREIGLIKGTIKEDEVL